MSSLRAGDVVIFNGEFFIRLNTVDFHDPVFVHVRTGDLCGVNRVRDEQNNRWFARAWGELSFKFT
jgi:hypothetical protein